MNLRARRRRMLLDKLTVCPICHLPVDEVAHTIAQLLADDDAQADGHALVSLMIAHVRAEHGDENAAWFRAIADAAEAAS